MFAIQSYRDALMLGLMLFIVLVHSSFAFPPKMVHSSSSTNLQQYVHMVSASGSNIIFQFDVTVKPGTSVCSRIFAAGQSVTGISRGYSVSFQAVSSNRPPGDMTVFFGGLGQYIGGCDGCTPYEGDRKIVSWPSAFTTTTAVNDKCYATTQDVSIPPGFTQICIMNSCNITGTVTTLCDLTESFQGQFAVYGFSTSAASENSIDPTTCNVLMTVPSDSGGNMYLIVGTVLGALVFCGCVGYAYYYVKSMERLLPFQFYAFDEMSDDEEDEVDGEEEGEGDDEEIQISLRQRPTNERGSEVELSNFARS